MKYERIIWVLAVLIVGGASFYTGRQQGVTAGQATAQQTANDFFAQRVGVPPGQGLPGATPGAGGGFQRGAGQGANGEVVSIEGNTIMVKSQRDGTTLTVQVGAQTQIRKQADGQLGDIKVGDTIVAIGPRSGDIITADTVQLGGFGGFGGFGPRGAAPNAPASSTP
jgi:hypothetical protein